MPSGNGGIPVSIKGEDDTVYEHAGVKVVVDSKSLAILDGTQIDYVSEGLNCWQTTN